MINELYVNYNEEMLFISGETITGRVLTWNDKYRTLDTGEKCYLVTLKHGRNVINAELYWVSLLKPRFSQRPYISGKVMFGGSILTLSKVIDIDSPLSFKVIRALSALRPR